MTRLYRLTIIAVFLSASLSLSAQYPGAPEGVTFTFGNYDTPSESNAWSYIQWGNIEEDQLGLIDFGSSYSTIEIVDEQGGSFYGSPGQYFLSNEWNIGWTINWVTPGVEYTMYGYFTQYVSGGGLGDSVLWHEIISQPFNPSIITDIRPDEKGDTPIASYNAFSETLNVIGLPSASQILLKDCFGRIVLSAKSNYPISLTNLTKGLYIIETPMGNKRFMKM